MRAHVILKRPSLLLALWVCVGASLGAGQPSTPAPLDAGAAARQPGDGCVEVTARLLEPRPAIVPCGRAAFVGAFVYEAVSTCAGCPTGLLVADVLCPDLAAARGVKFSPGELHRLRLCPARPSYSTTVAPPSPRPELPRFAAEVSPLLAPDCGSRADLAAHAGEACRVVGTYLLRTFEGKGGKQLGPWPVLRLGDGSEVMVESLWDPAKAPDSATVKRLAGKTVEAVGVVHAAPPSATPENFAFWCLSPVTQLHPR